MISAVTVVALFMLTPMTIMVFVFMFLVNVLATVVYIDKIHGLSASVVLSAVFFPVLGVFWWHVQIERLLRHDHGGT